MQAIQCNHYAVTHSLRYIKVPKVCFTSAQCHSWPHWPQRDSVKLIITFHCCHQGNPHYLLSTCLHSLLTALTTEKWHIFRFIRCKPTMRFSSCASHLLKVILGHIDHRVVVWMFLSLSSVAILANHIHYLMSTCLLSLLTTLTTKKLHIFLFDPLQAHIKVIISSFTSAQSNSWPHWPQGDALNFFVTFLCYHPVNPHWPHYLSSTCSLSFLTTLTTKWWCFILF